MKVAFATNPRVTFKDGVTKDLEFTVPAGFVSSAIRCATNADSTGKTADVFLSLYSYVQGKIVGTAAFRTRGTGAWPAAPGLAVPIREGDYVLSVTASNITHTTGTGAFGLTVQVSGATKRK